MSKAHHYYGFDIGGTKIELACYDDELRLVHQWRIPTPTQDLGQFLDAVVALVHQADAQVGEQGHIGVGLPGIVDPVSGRHLSANVPALTNQNLAALLTERLQRPIAIGNDCQCFALSEANGGAAADAPTMFGLILGTGMGGGYCVEQRLIRGMNGTLGDVGHVPVPAVTLDRYRLPVLDCPCGLRGCIERYASGSGISAIHAHFTGQRLDAVQIVCQASDGNAAARHTLDVHIAVLAHGIATLILHLDPHAIVLGGGLSKLDQLYTRLPALIATHLFAGPRTPPILRPVFGDASGTRGAAILARQNH
ncbi:ROK family protein [Dyella flava]|uniref:N-acetylglucosamine kinase n=1 Tax=Dyella flava TaxID=1920170 RepID=A0ABS2JYZ4_9GAMM|nr:ROK family protein [Dyella flava]MBM7124089.1 ROK family protein [Dyella flava]GLQ49988.1 transcriptional regulator [Dyella flava]